MWAGSEMVSPTVVGDKTNGAFSIMWLGDIGFSIHDPMANHT